MMVTMHALIIDPSRTPAARSLANTRLSATAGFDERWLQEMLFEHPVLMPMDLIDPGAGSFIPVCRELALPTEGRPVFLDIFGFASTGRPVLVECKLWRNPQARREVIAQILEYASLLQRWNYADLTARVAAKLSRSGNVLFDIAKAAQPTLDEARFVDNVSTCLSRGDFDLVIAGDGIRGDLHGVAGFLGMGGGHLARVALVEFQVWSDDAGSRIVLPSISLRTEVVTRTVLVGEGGRPLALAETEEVAEEVEAVAQPEAAAKRAAIRAFWDDFIAHARFDHPEQPAPRIGGVNWVRLPLPPPGRLTAYRSQGVAGVFVTLVGERAAERFEALQAEKVTIEQEIGETLTFERDDADAAKFTIVARHPFDTNDAATFDQQKHWLLRTTNAFVTAFRPRLTSFAVG